MPLTQLLRALVRQWWVVLLVTSAVLTLTTIWTATRPTVYEAHTQVFVSLTAADADVSALQQAGSFTQQRVKSYAEVAQAPAVLAPVARELGLTGDDAVESLARQVTVNNPTDTVLLDVAVRDTNPRRAADIANVIGLVLPRVIDTLETPATRQSSPVRITVTERARVPYQPVEPAVAVNLSLGLLIGLGLGVAAGLLRHNADTAVSGPADLQAITGATPLGMVPFDPRTPARPLISPTGIGGRADAFRALRTNLQFADVDTPPRVIVVTSPEAGEGKSTTASNIALTMALSGARVALVDADLRRPAVHRILGVSSAAGLTSVLGGGHRLEEVMVAHSHRNLLVLPSGPATPNPSELLGSQAMEALLGRLAATFDVVIVDSPPMLAVTDAAVLTALADGALLVARVGSTRREALARALEALRAVNGRLLGTVLNGVPAQRSTAAYGLPPDDGTSGAGGSTRRSVAMRRTT